MSLLSKLIKYQENLEETIEMFQELLDKKVSLPPRLQKILNTFIEIGYVIDKSIK
ncbi:Uncharacterised protein [uncultured archaeon]|nr:Uncharacterised protein [uncultured archaeon]